MERIETLRILHEFYFNRLGFCGCGTPKDIMIAIKDTLTYFNNKSESDYNTYESNSEKDDIVDIINLKDDGDKSNGIKLLLLNVLTNADVLEHSTTVRNSWLTPYGKEVLTAFNELSDIEILFELDFSKEF